MSEHRHDDDSFERELLRSARGDAPPEGASDRAWAGLNAALAGVSTVQQPPAPAPARSPASWLKGAIAGAMGGSALTFALLAHRAPPQALVSVAAAPSAAVPSASSLPVASPPSGSPPGLAAASALPPPAPIAGPAARALEPPRARPSLSPRLASKAASPLPARASASASSSPLAPAPEPPAPATASPSPSPPRPEPSLAAEIAALDEARRHLLSGDADRALAAVAGYRERFPQGTLRPEADALSIEAHAARGDRERAKREAEVFLERYPAAPQRERVKALAR